jgi:dGTPase
MELADDIAYSIHDAEDFYRAGLVPLESLAREDSLESLRFLDRALVRLQVNDDSHRKRLEAAFRQSMTFCAIEEPYRGTKLQRVALKAWASGQIQQFVNSIDVVEHDEELSLDVPQETKDTLSIPKQLTWQYVILNSRLATQQVGHDRVIRELFAEYVDAIEQRRWTVLPPRFADEAERFASDAKRREALWGKLDEKQHAARLAADVIASMSDREALAMHRRLRGFSPGSVLEALVL